MLIKDATGSQSPPEELADLDRVLGLLHEFALENDAPDAVWIEGKGMHCHLGTLLAFGSWLLRRAGGGAPPG